jgi:hypothetical protein
MHRLVHMFAVGLVAGLLLHGVGRSEIAQAASGQEMGGPWQTVRAHLPPGVPVLAPTWLPARFAGAQTTAWVSNEAISGGPAYQVGYRDSAGDVLLLALGNAVNSANPTRIEHIAIRGVAGELDATPAWPALAILWRGGTWQHTPLRYAAQTGSLSRDELVHIVESLAPVKPATAVTGLPDAGGGGASTGERAVLLAVALGGCFLLTGRLACPAADCFRSTRRYAASPRLKRFRGDDGGAR